jgi:hypothetical protein
MKDLILGRAHGFFLFLTFITSIACVLVLAINGSVAGYVSKPKPGEQLTICDQQLCRTVQPGCRAVFGTKGHVKEKCPRPKT